MRALDALAYFPSAFRKFALRFSIVIWINHGTRLVFLRLSAKGSKLPLSLLAHPLIHPPSADAPEF